MVTAGAGSSAYPTTSGAYLRTFNGGDDQATLSKLNGSLTTLAASTYLSPGGTIGMGVVNNTDANGVAIDTSGNIYVAGYVNCGCANFPTTSGVVQPAFEGASANADSFVVELNSGLTAAAYSTLLGGTSNDDGKALTVDNAGEAIVVGEAGPGFPTTTGAFATTPGSSGAHPYAAKLSANGTSLLWATYIPGDQVGSAYAVAQDGLGHILVAGKTYTGVMPVSPDATQPNQAGDADAFLVELSGDGRNELYGTYLGSTSFDSGNGVTAGPDHRVYVVGESDGSGFPQQNPGQTTGYGGGSSDAFVAEFSASALGPTYPVGTADSGDHGRLSASSITTGPNGAIVSALSAYVGPTSGGDQIALGLYTNSGSNPGALLTSSAATTVSGAGWNTVSISPTALAANSTYWIVYNSSGTTDNLYKTGDSSGRYRYTGAVTFGTWPSAFPTVTGSGTPGYMLYATVSGSTASTLGITGALGTQDVYDYDEVESSPITTGAQGGILTALSAYINPGGSGDQYDLSLYSDNGGGPGTLVVDSGPTAVGAAGWNTAVITPTTLAANTTYWIAYNSSGVNDNVVFSGNWTGQYAVSDTVPFGPAGHTWPGSEFTGGPGYLFYATLAGPNNPPPTPMPTATVTMHLAYTYDNADRRTGLTLPDGKSQSWGYDAAGRVNSLTQAGSSPNTYTVSHNGAGDTTTLIAPNGGKQIWSYDGAGRITGTTWLTGTTALFTQTVTLDAAGQRTASSDSWGSTSYGYDTAGRLTSASYPDGSSEADQYDASGNRTVITGTTTLAGTNVITNTYDLADQLTGTASTQGNTTYSYDGNGNQTASYGITGVVTNTYNDLDQLTNAVGPGTNVSYVYDGQGDRLRSYEQSGTTPVL